MRVEKQYKGTLIVISNFGGEMPRTEHNTVDEIFYPRSFGARNVVQDRSKGCVSITDYFTYHPFLFVLCGIV